MNITILGPGAIGSLYAYKLKQAGHDVSIWGRSPNSTVDIQLDHLPPLPFANQNLVVLKRTDLLIVTLKAWQVEAALSPLLPLLHPDTMILFLHNGMGSVDKLANALANFPVLLGTSTHGALRVNALHVNHTGLGETHIGAWNDKGQQCQFLSDVLHHALSPVKWHTSIQHALWTKLIINCAINPLTALENCSNGQLSEPRYRHQIEQIIDEAQSCAEKVDVTLDKASLKETVFNVITKTAKNYSSMQQDISQQRTSEIEFITGYVVSIAERYQLDIPENNALFKQIKCIEASWSKHD
ncbi:2-dehydropantoate 2-reductase [Vibrio methylphosphonaticus]|uniref:2-dehydropantoate 2-reductase n=1 Tax=Vibrio methylphosphonaticus TaxID=2946866 RepID=UPI00202A6D27|nr:2-dehydropantoate 2-reductase [Vibrio methylphosphonaticus]MCL9773177.1 2-dehydropantoate 2-reductase [Vibrio methylphosphonaticus]